MWGGGELQIPPNNPELGNGLILLIKVGKSIRFECEIYRRYLPLSHGLVCMACSVVYVVVSLYIGLQRVVMDSVTQ